MKTPLRYSWEKIAHKAKGDAGAMVLCSGYACERVLASD